MKDIRLELTSDNILIINKQYPNAEKMIELTGQKAKQLRNLALHESDLMFAKFCLDQMRGEKLVNQDGMLALEAFWRCALIHTMKCFGDNQSRGSLDKKKVLRGEPPEAGLVFDELKNIRNRHVVHDENGMSQIAAFAVINKQDQKHKIENIGTLHARAMTVSETLFDNLDLLCTTTLSYVRAENEKLRKSMEQDLEVMKHEDLIKMNEPSFKNPARNDVHGKRGN